MMRERLNFAAGALTGVNSGLEAAADTLERRYCESLPQVADKAADRACRGCPNNMVCWGQKYELFHREFDRLVKVLRSGGELSVQSLSPMAAAECIDRDGVIRAVRKAYGQYLSASGEQQRIRELRRVYSGQLTSLSGILADHGRCRREDTHRKPDCGAPRGESPPGLRALPPGGVRDPHEERQNAAGGIRHRRAIHREGIPR